MLNKLFIRNLGLSNQLLMARMFTTANYNLKHRGNHDLMTAQGELSEFTANNLWDNPGSRRWKKQLGRGPGSGKG